MPTVDQQRQKLLTLLKELFQINQPDLDFGFYRIMHAKADEVSRFLDEDLLQIIADAFGETSSEKQADLKKAYLDEIETARQYGAEKPEEAPKVKEAKARWESAMDTATAEGEIYDHLYRFFERYYDNGDFLSKRYYARESASKAAPYAVPYDGSEVYLHWANKDQYYIKTSEYFTDFTFDLSKAREAEGKIDPISVHQAGSPMRVHFRIVDATEGEHGNIKAANGQKRYFILHEDNPVSLENGELIIRFEYRPDSKKSGQDAVWQRKRMDEAVKKILNCLDGMKGAAEFARLLNVPIPTDKQKDRTLLAKYVNQYTARNTMDYFIHKDLSGFLSRELNFYIKNEVMRLDDIENAKAPAVQSYLFKIKVLRRIASKLIDFLAQLEDFQKILWLKKKMVVDSHFCISLDRIPEEHFPTIAANDEQRRAWVSLLSIDKIEGYSEPLNIDFLRKNLKLPVDTSLFQSDFQEQLLAAQENLDSSLTGVMMHSDNFHALNLAAKQFGEEIKSIYIDPPYNTNSSSIPYKNNYKHSSFATLMRDRLGACYSLLRKDGALFVSIDKTERTLLEHTLDEIFGDENHIEELIWTQATANSQLPNYSTNHEYVEVYAKDRAAVEADKEMFREPKPGFSEVMELVNKLNPDYPSIANIEREIKELYLRHKQEYREKVEINGKEWDAQAKRQDPWRGLYPYNRAEYRGSDGRFVPEEEAEANAAHIWVWSEIPTSAPASKQSPTTKDPNHPNYRYYKPIHPVTKKTCPHPQSGWKFPEKPDPKKENRRSFESLQADNRIAWGEAEKKVPRTKGFLHEVETNIGTSVFYEYNDGEAELGNMFGESGLFLSPKSSKFVKKFIVQSTKPNSWFSDFFGGSGSSAHAVIQANREDGGVRKFLLVEMGHYFDWLMKPRVLKAFYASDWKSGIPRSKDSVSALLKIVRLESYEDCLNNLEFNQDETRAKAIAKSKELREEYMLHYMLETETRGSRSLLNIDSFIDPTAYQLKVKKPGTDEYEVRNVDLIETFNYLIGLRVEHMDAPQAFSAEFYREPDPELPDDKHTRLKMAGRKQTPDGPWWFRKIEGWVPGDNGKNEKILVVWRKLTEDQEKDNLMLDEWFKTIRINPRDFEYDTIYVNGSNNLPNLRLEGENWKVRLIEEDFMQRMWDVEDV